jgi:hypothetical protein
LARWPRRGAGGRPWRRSSSAAGEVNALAADLDHFVHGQMGAAQAQLQQLALDAAVPPAGFLPWPGEG